MSVAPLPKRTIKLHTGSGSDQIPLPTTFIRQLDVIVPTEDEANRRRLDGLMTRYAVASGVRLSDVMSPKSAAEGTNASTSRMSVRDEEGAWFIDGQRGMLVLRVLKERYEALGIAGKEKNNAYNIRVNLRDRKSKLYARAKHAFEKWDKSWEVWTVMGQGESEAESAMGVPKNVEAERVELQNVFVPASLPSEEDEDESWAELLEWVGMCTIGNSGSPRISPLDQVKPYISRYSAPEGSKPGSVTRFRWKGLLSPMFVRETIQAAREDKNRGLVAFSISSFDHVPPYLAMARCEACAGAVVSGVWALAEVVGPD